MANSILSGRQSSTTTDSLLEKLSDLRLKRLDPSTEAGLWITSLPWPRAPWQELGLGSHPTYCAPIGQWPGEPANTPRRLLLIADGGNSAPECINLQSPVATIGALPTTEMVCFARSANPLAFWEQHSLRISWGGKSIELALGLRTKNEVHWWEACNLVTLRETGHCREVEMGGAIPLQLNDLDLMREYSGHTNPFLHKHNWLNGHLYLRLHSNGVCEVFVHHINSKFYDDGLDLNDAVAVVGIRTTEDAGACSGLVGPWDGTRNEFNLGDIAFDVTETARLATPQQPGSMTQEEDFLVWQPYQGAEVFAGEGTQQLTGNPFICHAEDRIIPRGVARTLRFSFSLSDRSPRIVRYLAPSWWYGLCEEFGATPLQPVEGDFDAQIEQACNRIRGNIRVGGFEDGWLPLFLPDEPQEAPTQRRDSSWKGDLPHALLMTAWRTGNTEDYHNALRLTYHFTDIAVDHAMQAVRMQGYSPPAISPTLGRVQAPTAAYFELGDPYLLRTAKAVLETTFWTHMNSWPRMAVGRDACFINGALLLYRYCGDDHYRQIAHEAAMAVVHSQRPNGSFGDQGGGAGIHGVAAYITKAWMGLLATSGLIDYLEIFPEEDSILGTVRKFADWLLETRLPLDGRLGWTYQNDYNGRRDYAEDEIAAMFAKPTSAVWHHESLGRLLGYCTMRFGNPLYLQAYYESKGIRPPDHIDYAVCTALYNLPWLQDHALTSESAT